MYFLYKCVFGFCHEIDKGEIVDDVNPMGIWVVLRFLLVSYVISQVQLMKPRRTVDPRKSTRKRHTREGILHVCISFCVS